MKLLGLDFETTGLDTATDRVIEIGAVLWDSERKVPLEVLSSLIRHTPEEKVIITPEIIEITGIQPMDLEVHGTSSQAAFNALVQMALRADLIVAHNGTFFDQPLYKAERRRLGLNDAGGALSRGWLDTRLDVTYPPEMLTRSGGYLEAQHGLTNEYPHRALFDTLTMLQMLSRYSIHEVIKNAATPLVKVQALVTFDEKDKARSRGYYWSAEEKAWLKILRTCHVEAEKQNCGFEILVLRSL